MKTFSRIYLFSKYGDWTGSQEGPEKKQCIIIIIKHWDSKSLETGFIRQCFSLTCKRVALCSCESRLSDDDQQRCCSQYRSCLADPGRRVQKYFLGLILLFKSCFLHWLAVTKLPKNFLFSKEEQQELQCRKNKELSKWINHEIETFFWSLPSAWTYRSSSPSISTLILLTVRDILWLITGTLLTCDKCKDHS